LREWTPLAEQGNAYAQTSLGMMYYNGIGVPEDDKTAVKWYRLAAEQGVADAQYNLGYMYENGKGISQDDKTAVKWYTLAVEQGYTYAQTNLSILQTRMAKTKNTPPVVTAKKSSPPSPSAAEIENEELRREVARLKKQNQSKPKQVAKKKPEPQPTPEPKQVATKSSKPYLLQFKKVAERPDDVAVIIGNSDYSDGKDIPNVTPAYADAAGIKNYVTQALGIAEDNIIYLKDATQTDLVGTFGNKDNHKGRLFRYLTQNKSNVFVFYSGHGAPGDGDTNYLVPTDAEASLIDLNGYSLKTLYQNLSKLPAESVTVVLEACFSGASAAGTVINNASPVYLKAKDTGTPSNITVIAAGAANQIASWETDKSHGLFTKYFLKGMSGEADNDNDSKVSWDELRTYLAKTVTRSAMRNYGREQTPQIVVGK
jgi:hypothetical protein